MAREGREVWAKRVERWRDSGLSAKEFADEVGVNAHTLRHWSWVLARDATTARADEGAAVEFVEVRATPIAAAGDDRVEVVLPNGTTVRIPRRLEATALDRLLAATGTR